MSLSKKISISLLVPSLFSPVSENLMAPLHSTKKKPVNVLFLLADDLRANTIHTLGNNEIITPNLDKLSQSGTSFTHAYIMGGSQGAVSVPSRAMIMTGKYLANLEKTGAHIPDGHIMLGEYLLKNGYDSHGIGKWHNGQASYSRSFSSGADIFFGGMTDQFNVKVWDYDPTGKYSKDGKINHINKHSSEIFADDAVKYLDNYRNDKPFFLYVAFTSPHDPRKMPPEYLQMYDTSKINLPENFLPQHPFDNGELKVRDEMLAGFPRTKSEIKIHIRDYYAIITHLDVQIGRIIEALKKSGQYENTIIVFAGDNGLALGQHGLMGKQSVYEHSVGVPLVVSGPGIPKNQKRSALCYLIDIYPTLCKEAGLEIPATVEGKSLNGCINGSDQKVRDKLYFAYRDFQRAVRDEHYKLIEYKVNGKRTTQLFDLLTDPWEKNNLSDNSQYAKQVNILRQAMLEQKQLTGDKGEFWNGIEFFNETK